jgi:hypothetical protein
VADHIPGKNVSKCPIAHRGRTAVQYTESPPSILSRPLPRRAVLRGGGVIAGAVGTLALLEGLAVLPERVAMADPGTLAQPDIQFDIEPFMPAARTVDGVSIALPPVHTAFVTATLQRRPTTIDQIRMENDLRIIEAAYPYSPSGVFTHVAFSDNYFARFPRLVVAAAMPNTLSGNQPVLKRAVAGPTDVASGNRVLELRRPEFTVPVRMENNDLLFTIRSDNPTIVTDVVNWISGSNRLAGRSIASPAYVAEMTVTSTRAMFVQQGLPRSIADSQRLPFASFVNPASPMWMGFFDQQVNASAPAQDVTFVGGHGIKLTTADPGDYFDNGSIQHLSHLLLDLQQFYVDGREPEEPVDHRENFDERLQYMFESPSQVAEDPVDPFTDGGGPRNLSTRGAVLPNVFRGADYARQSAVQFGRMGHLSQLHRTGRTADGRPIHLRIDGPGFDALDTTTRRNTPKLQFSGFFPSADFFAELRRAQASVDLLEELDLEEEDHGIERFITTTRRQNFLIPPRRHRAFPLAEFT